MDIKEYTGEKHKWIYGTTYWLGSGFSGSPSVPNQLPNNDYYISNEGMLCAIGRQGECIYFPYPIGNGIRPLVIIPKTEIRKVTNDIINPETGNKTAAIAIILVIGAAVLLYSNRKKQNN